MCGGARPPVLDDLKLSPTGEASGYPYPKWVLYSQKMLSNRVGKGETHFASWGREQANLHHSLSSTQIKAAREVGPQWGVAAAGSRTATGLGRRWRGGARPTTPRRGANDDAEAGNGSEAGVADEAE